MTEVSAQVSLYPLEQADISPPIRAVWETLEANSVHFEPGPMSTLVVGDSRAVFAVLQAAFERAADFGHAVMTVTVSNACPLPGATDGGPGL